MATAWGEAFGEALRENAEDVVDAIGRIQDNRRSRLPVITRPTVLRYSPVGESDADLVAPGTLTVFLGRRGDALLAEVSEIYAAASSDRSQQFADRLRDIGTETRAAATEGVEATVTEMIASDVLVDVRYRGTTIIHSLTLVHGLPIVAILLPYNGGTISEQEFSLWQYRRNEDAPLLDAVVVLRSPELTPEEDAALRDLPPEAEDVNIGSPVQGILPLTTATILLVAVVFATPTITATAGAGLSAVATAERVREEVPKLGPLPTAAALTERASVSSREGLARRAWSWVRQRPTRVA
jgi:hypothetical protein